MDASPQLAIAHVLFLDVVNPADQQTSEEPLMSATLQALASEQPEFRQASAAGDLLCIPTGDGMALVFFREPVAPLRCAVQIARALGARSDMRLRMGIHSGPIYRLGDGSAHASVYGGGITLAQRAMDCGDAGHILVSGAAAELACQVGAWPLADLGECEMRRDQRLRLFNFYGRGFGNPERPARLRDAAAGAHRIVLLYRRGRQADEDLLETLASALADRGYDVFWDRHLKVGMNWAEEIGRRIREADAVIPLVSETSMRSEMLAVELQTAREAAGQQGGRPRLLPVRVEYTGPLPEAVAGVLDPIEHAFWAGPGHTDQLVQDLSDGLQAPQAGWRPASCPGGRTVTGDGRAAASPVDAPEAETGSAPELEAVGGAVPLGSHFYVTRPSDPQFLGAIERRDSIVLVNGARQMGKSSLLARGLQQARQAGARVSLTDFQSLGAEQMESADAFFRALGETLAEQLDLETLPDEVWRPGTGAVVNFQRYMRRTVLGGSSAPVVWGLDEIDRLFGCPYGSEVFGLFRSWYNARALDPTGPWSQLTMAIAYATEAHIFISDVNQSPFNVGTRVALADFTLDQVADLNQRYGEVLSVDGELSRFFQLLNGHPYLTRRGLNELKTGPVSIAEFEAAAASDDGPFGDHLRRILVLLAHDPEMTQAMSAVVRGEGCPTPESFYRLRSAGLIAGGAPRQARARCPLYQQYLESHLLPQR
jgi:hypothetical protein